MKIEDVKNNAFAIPFASPSYPRGPFRFYNREFVIITYRTDMDALRAVVPEPLEIIEPVVKYEFIRMPDSVGFGDYTETGQVIPVRFEGREGNYPRHVSGCGRPSWAGARSGAFPRSWPSPTCAWKARCWWARSIAVRSAA
jgi:acetoacetate decarboxylase